MEEYKNLTVNRIYNLLDLSPANSEAAQLRQGMFDIWWDRDYATYGAATNRNYNAENWPVSGQMHLYVRRDFIAQIWEYGIGEGTIVNPLDELEQNVCNLNWQDLAAVQVFEAPVTLINPIGIALDDDGTVYVAEEFGHRIAMFDAQGDYIGSFGQQGLTLENALGFNRPNSLAIGPDGKLFVADTWNYRIQVLTGDQVPVTSWGQAYTGGFDSITDPVDGFWGPRDVVVSDDGRIFVADTGNKRVRVYRLEDGIATFQYDIGSGGSALGQLDEPSGLALHPDGRLYVADTWNRRVSVFTVDGVPIDSYRVRGWYEDQGNRPYLAVDADRDLLYVSDPDSGRVLVYTSGGDCIGSFGQAAGVNPTLGQFGLASGLAVDAEGYVYVVDNELGRILKFEPFAFAPLQPDTPIEDGNDGEAAE